MLDALQQASKVVGEAEIFRLAQVPERRYVGFRDYPLDESLKLTVASARVLYPRYPLGEGLRRVGQTVFDALLKTHVGRAVFGVLARDVELVVLSGPKAFKLLVSTGQITAEKTGYRAFTFHATMASPPSSRRSTSGSSRGRCATAGSAAASASPSTTSPPGRWSCGCSDGAAASILI